MPEPEFGYKFLVERQVTYTLISIHAFSFLTITKACKLVSIRLAKQITSCKHGTRSFSNDGDSKIQNRIKGVSTVTTSFHSSNARELLMNGYNGILNKHACTSQH